MDSDQVAAAARRMDAVFERVERLDPDEMSKLIDALRRRIAIEEARILLERLRKPR